MLEFVDPCSLCRVPLGLTTLGLKGFLFGLCALHLSGEFLDLGGNPRGKLLLFPILGINFCGEVEAFLGEGLGFKLLFDDLEGLHLFLNASSILIEEIFILDVVGGLPGFDLIAKALKFLDLPFGLTFELFLLGRVGGSVHLVHEFDKTFNPFIDLFYDSVDFGYGMQRRGVGV